MARYRYDVDGRRVVAGDPSNFDYTVYVDDGVRVERTVSYETFIEIQAFGERIALKRSTEWPRDAETPFALPPELPLAGGLLALAGLLAFAVCAQAHVLVIRRPAHAGVASLLVVALVLGPAPPPVKAGGGTGYYVHWELADRLGTGLVMVDDTGARLVHRSFTPFGQQDEVMGNATWLPVNYGTHLYEPDAGLYAMEARWYDAKGGTFLSVDPVVASASDPQSFNAYAYARSNPVSYLDPTGMSCINLLIGSFCRESGQDAPRWNWADGGGAWGGLSTIGEMPFVSVAAGPMELGSAFAARPMLGTPPIEQIEASGVQYAALLANEDGSVTSDPKPTIGIIDPLGINKGYRAFKSFSALKRFLGPAGPGRQWHHIVEQSQIGRFGAEAIHRLDNVISLPRGVHQKINAFYSSKRAFTGGKTVREWLASKSFQEQYEFGKKVMREVLGD